MPEPSQITSSGAMAAIGMAWLAIIYGKKIFSTTGWCARKYPLNSASELPAANPKTTSHKVISVCRNKTPDWTDIRKRLKIRDGAGRINSGYCDTPTRTSQRIKPHRIDNGGIRFFGVNFFLFERCKAIIKKAPFLFRAFMNLNQVTSFFIPDYTVDLRISLSQLSLVDCHHRSGIGFFKPHPALKECFLYLKLILLHFLSTCQMFWQESACEMWDGFNISNYWESSCFAEWSQAITISIQMDGKDGTTGWTIDNSWNI